MASIGSRSARGDTTYADEVARWYDYRFKGIDTGVGSEPPVKLFVMNENRWRYEEQWPPADAGEIELFLHSGGRANSVGGDGVLSASEPSEERPDRYGYDPSDPVMSLMDLGAQAAVRDQSPLDAREDILVYATPPLDRPVTVIGPVTLRLWVASSAPQTDFTAKLIDVRPDGLAVNVSYGIIRTSYMEGYDEPKPMEPDTPYELTIRLSPTGITVRRWAPHQAGRGELGLPELRPQPQHRGRLLVGLGVTRGAPDRLPRPRAPFASAALGGVEAPTRRSCSDLVRPPPSSPSAGED